MSPAFNSVLYHSALNVVIQLKHITDNFYVSGTAGIYTAKDNEFILQRIMNEQNRLYNIRGDEVESYI